MDNGFFIGLSFSLSEWPTHEPTLIFSESTEEKKLTF